MKYYRYPEATGDLTARVSMFPAMKALRQAADMVGDLAMVCPTKYFAEEAAAQVKDIDHFQAFLKAPLLPNAEQQLRSFLLFKNLSVHYYEFDFRSSFGTWPDWVGTTHGEEVS